MGVPWRELWDELNERQRFYLTAIYRLDQKAERFYKHEWDTYRRGYPPPASMWRWIYYDDPAGDRGKTPLYLDIHQADLIDPGTGSTFKALDERGYIERRYEGLEFPILSVRMTRRGRMLIRKNDPDYRPRKKRPKGQLTKAQWWLLKRLYEAKDDRGVRTEELYWGTVALRLRDYRPEPLLKETRYWSADKMYIRNHCEITQAGIAHYESNRDEYEELYDAEQ